MRRLALAPPAAAVAAIASLALLGVLVPVPSVALAPASAPADGDTALVSTGYVEPGTATRVVARDAHALRTLGVDGVTVGRGGGSVGTPTADQVDLLAAAHAHGLRAELLVSNYSDRFGDFDPRVGARLLRDPTHVQAVADALAETVAGQGWDGVQVDLESLSAGDADGLTAFVLALQSAMSPEKSVSIAVMASTSSSAYAAGGYHLAELGAAVDTLTLMTYDQHGPGWSGPGPIGSLSWQRRAVAAALTAVPASRLDLGVAGYGYTWRRDGSGITVTDAQARRRVHADGARAVWHRGAGEWSARLSDGTRMWWSDHRSLRLRTRLALADDLHGLSVWRLGSADPL